MSKKFDIKPPIWPREYSFQEFIKLNPHIINENQLITLYNQYLNKYLTELGEKKIHFKQSKITQLLTELKEFQQTVSIATPGGGSKFTNKYSVTFDRSSETYISTTFNPDDYELYNGFTVSYWIRPDELGSSRFAMGRQPVNAQRFNFGIHSTVGSVKKVHIAVGNNRQRTSLHDMEIGNWYHWVVTFAGGVAGARYIYFNGNDITDSNNTATWNAYGGAGGELWFGARNNDDGSYTNGWDVGLTDVAIFDEVKDITWISNAYNNGTPSNLKDESGLVGYWRFEEGNGTTIEDTSGNDNHGTFAPVGSQAGDTTALPTWSTDIPK